MNRIAACFLIEVQRGELSTWRREPLMRTYHVVGVAILVMVGLGIKIFCFPNWATDAHRDLPKRASMETFRMHLDFPKVRDIPVQDVKDPI
jgi:hypothetical protein